MKTTESDLVLALEFVTLGAGAAIPSSLLRETFAAESFQAETEKIRVSSQDWTAGSGIQGLGIGGKISQGEDTGELAMRVYVEKKKAKAKVRNPIPKTVPLPEIGEITTDVVEIGKVVTESFPDRVRPAMPGSGVGHRAVSVGTFGCLVRKRGSADGLYILSNSHVLANSGWGVVGDDIIQPGRHDGGGTGDVLGKLEGFIPFDFASGYPNLVDAAIAKVAKNRVKPQIRILDTEPAGVSHTLRRGMAIKKVGRTTDFTTGVILDIHYRTRIPYRASKSNPKYRRKAGLRELVLCSRYSQGGDSGSVVLNNRNRVLGLHFAGSASSSIFCRIRNVFDALDIELA